MQTIQIPIKDTCRIFPIEKLVSKWRNTEKVKVLVRYNDWSIISIFIGRLEWVLSAGSKWREKMRPPKSFWTILAKTSSRQRPNQDRAFRSRCHWLTCFNSTSRLISSDWERLSLSKAPVASRCEAKYRCSSVVMRASWSSRWASNSRSSRCNRSVWRGKTAGVTVVRRQRWKWKTSYWEWSKILAEDIYRFSREMFPS